MPTPTSGITFRTIQEAMPEYHLSQDLLHGVLTAMAPPPPDASAAWRKARLTRIIEEIAARVPMDPAQGHLAGQLVLVQFLADEMMQRLMTPDLPLAERRLTARTTDDLLRSVVRLERALERRQARVLPFRDVGAVDGFDLAALDGLWCRGVQAAAAAGARAVAARRRRRRNHRRRTRSWRRSRPRRPKQRTRRPGPTGRRPSPRRAASACAVPAASSSRAMAGRWRSGRPGRAPASHPPPPRPPSRRGRPQRRSRRRRSGQPRIGPGRSARAPGL